MGDEQKRKCKIIACANRKGGVGKTTSTGLLAVGTTGLGRNVGIVDGDAQGHVSLNFGLLTCQEENPRDPEHPKMVPCDGLYEVLVKNVPVADVIAVVPRSKLVSDAGNLYVLPGYLKNARIADHLDEEGQFKFLAMCEEFAKACDLDYIFVDTQPSITNSDGPIYFAADGYVLVTEADKPSIDGISNVYDQIRRIAKHRKNYLQRDTRVFGVLPNKVRRTKNCNAALDTLKAAFGDVMLEPTPLATVFSEAFSEEQTLFTYEPDAPVLAALWRNVRRLDETCQASYN